MEINGNSVPNLHKMTERTGMPATSIMPAQTAGTPTKSGMPKPAGTPTTADRNGWNANKSREDSEDVISRTAGPPAKFPFALFAVFWHQNCSRLCFLPIFILHFGLQEFWHDGLLALCYSDWLWYPVADFIVNYTVAANEYFLSSVRQRWASTLANMSNARHQSNTRHKVEKECKVDLIRHFAHLCCANILLLLTLLLPMLFLPSASPES